MQVFSESWRLMQGSSEAHQFRSEAANDEFDGCAPIQRSELAIGKLGGTASSPRPKIGMKGLFF